MNETMVKFGYPDTLVKEFDHWVILLRPQQATLGALVVICKDQATTFSMISAEAFTELKNVTKTLETGLKKCFSYNKINYLMLMMVDPDVHFHVLPRYAGTKLFEDMEFYDAGWPGLPDLSYVNEIDLRIKQGLMDTLQQSLSS
ncbi:MAG: HIT family protein [Deltaproteobacteria bacterium]|jgi:diadenosine tetraphosphate (Ap4A) HIT family hydrolase|nr:HIT family protein [Deltaproteobacteria bacterium]